MSTRPSPYRLDNQLSELHQSAANLTRYACIVSSRHIKDGVLRGRFNRTMAYYVRQVLADVRNGKIRAEEGLRQIELEHKSLRIKALEVAGVIAGATMAATGAGICYYSAMTACAVAGAPMIAHGVNNIYENSNNLSAGRTDTTGPLKWLYQKVAVAAGSSERRGSLAYSAVDIGLSGYGLLMLVKKTGCMAVI